MSTKSTIFCDDNYHLYRECFEEKVYLETPNQLIQLMDDKDWVEAERQIIQSFLQSLSNGCATSIGKLWDIKGDSWKANKEKLLKNFESYLENIE